MFGNDDSGGVGESDLGPEIFVVDTDVLLGTRAASWPIAENVRSCYVLLTRAQP